MDAPQLADHVMRNDFLDISKLEAYADEAVSLFLGIIPNIIGALLTLYIGFKVVNYLSKKMRHLLSHSFEKSLAGFLSSLVSVTLKILVIVAVAGMLGVQTTSFIAML